MEELLLIPGPTRLHPRVMRVMAEPQIGHSSSRFIEAFKELLELAMYAFKAKRGYPFVLTGSGTLAMEAAVVSLLEPSDKVLVVETGTFGKRFREICEAHGVVAEPLTTKLGEAASPSVIGEALDKGGFKALLMTHIDTQTTVLNPIHELVAEARKRGLMSLVDCISSLGGQELDFDRLGADVVITCSQKALAAPPGLSLLMLSSEAMERIRNRKSKIQSYYMDLFRWARVMEEPSVYLATPAVQLMMALREALIMVKEEGIERRWDRHEAIANAMRAGFEALGLEMVAEPKARGNTLSGIYVDDNRAGELQSVMNNRYKIAVAKGLYELADRMVRIAHFGLFNARDAISTLSALELALRDMGRRVEHGAALEAAEPHLRRAQAV